MRSILCTMHADANLQRDPDAPATSRRCRVLLVDDEPVGYLVYAPAAYVPGAAAFPTAPVSPDAVLMTTAPTGTSSSAAD